MEAQDLTDELRAACDACTRKKIKCDGLRPTCQQCQRRRTECVFTRKRKSGPKPKEVVPQHGPNIVPAYPNVAYPRASGWSGFPQQPFAVSGIQRAGVGVGVGINPASVSSWRPGLVLTTQQAPAVVGQREHSLLRVFLGTFNSFLPMVSANTLRDALNPLPPVLLDGGATEGDLQRSDARTAVLWGAITLGAVLANDSGVGAYMQRLQVTMRSCFDCPCQDAASAHLLLAAYWGLQGDFIKKTRYVRFADQILSELPEVSKDLAVSLHFLKVMAVCPLGGPMGVVFEFDSGLALPALPDPDEIARSEGYLPRHRVLYIVVHVVVNLAKAMAARARRQMADGPEPLLERLIDLLRTAEAIVERSPDWRSDMAEVVVKGFLSYVLLVAGRRAEAHVAVSAIPVAVKRAPLVLRFPLPWHVAHCSAQLLLRFGRAAEYTELLSSLMDKRDTSAFATNACRLPDLAKIGVSGAEPTAEQLAAAVLQLPPYMPTRCNDVSCLLAKHIFDIYDAMEGVGGRAAAAPAKTTAAAAAATAAATAAAAAAAAAAAMAVVNAMDDPNLAVGVPPALVMAEDTAEDMAGLLPPPPGAPARQNSFGLSGWLEGPEDGSDGSRSLLEVYGPALQDWLSMGA